MSVQEAFDRRARILGIVPTRSKATTELGQKREITAEITELLDDLEKAYAERDEAKASQLKAERALARAASEYTEQGNPLAPLLAKQQQATADAGKELTKAQQDKAEALALAASIRTELEASRRECLSLEEQLKEEKAARERLENKPPTVIENVKEVVVQVPAPVQPTQAKAPKSFAVRVTQRDGANRVRDIKVTPEF